MSIDYDTISGHWLADVPYVWVSADTWKNCARIYLIESFMLFKGKKKKSYWVDTYTKEGKIHVQELVHCKEVSRWFLMISSNVYDIINRNRSIVRMNGKKVYIPKIFFTKVLDMYEIYGYAMSKYKTPKSREQLFKDLVVNKINKHILVDLPTKVGESDALFCVDP